MEIEWSDGIKFQVRENAAAFICGCIAIILSVIILILWIFCPSSRGGGALMFVPLFCMAAFGVLCLVIFYKRRLIVEDMNLCYVNFFGKRKEFTLDDIGYCKIGGRGAYNHVVLYNLLGEKLCKLDFEMRDIVELHQYLVDNQVRVEWGAVKLDGEAMMLLDAIHREGSVCEEEISKCAERFFDEVEPLFREWEKRNQQFHVSWELGFVQYSLEDLTHKCKFRERVSSLGSNLQEIPVSYACVLEAYLKCGEEYIVDRKGEDISVIIPYMVRSKSYRIGEGTRIRKVDEKNTVNWLALHLEMLSREMPRHKYHTEAFTVRHCLSRKAGLVQEQSSEQ